MLLASVTPVIFCGVQNEEQICVCSSACMAPQRTHVSFTVAAEAPNNPSQLVTRHTLSTEHHVCERKWHSSPPTHIASSFRSAEVAGPKRRK